MLPTVISTDNVSPRERLAYWGEVVWQHAGQLHTDALGDASFDGRLEHAALADLRLCRIVASRHRVVRTPALARADGAGELKIVAQLAGAAWFEQGAQRVLLRPGDWGLYDTAAPYSVVNPQAVEQLVVMVPRQRLAALGGELSALTLRRISGRRGAGRLAFELMRAACAPGPSRHATGTERLAAQLADQLAEGLGAALLAHAGIASDLSLRAAARQRIEDYVDARLHDPQLSLDGIARAMGFSKRYLHKLFAGAEQTLASRIWQARLARIRADLADPHLLGRSITDIAFAWGFNSAAHFSRSFRGRYGVSPRHFRLGAQPAGADAA